MYTSYGNLRWNPREHLLKFCEMVLLVCPTAKHAAVLKQIILLGRHDAFNANLKFEKFLIQLRTLMDYTHHIAVQQTREGITVVKIEIIEKRVKGGKKKNALRGIHILNPQGENGGICLTFYVGRSATALAFKVNKFTLAQKLSKLGELPEPTRIHEWPKHSSTNER